MVQTTRGPEYPGEGSAGLARTEHIPMPSIGRIVHYVLSPADAKAINRRRVADTSVDTWPAGAQAHVGRFVNAGDVVSLIVTIVHSNEWVGGQAVLDGNDSLWVESVRYGGSYGQWSWPRRV